MEEGSRGGGEEMVKKSHGCLLTVGAGVPVTSNAQPWLCPQCVLHSVLFELLSLELLRSGTRLALRFLLFVVFPTVLEVKNNILK